MASQKFTYFAVDANGSIHTRKSHRAYTHAVLVQDTLERRMADATNQGWDKMFTSNFKYFQANEPAKVEAWTDASDYCAAMHDAMIAEVNKKQADGDFDKWSVAGFCGRASLAANETAKWVGKGYKAYAVTVTTERPVAEAAVERTLEHALEPASVIIARMKAKREALA